MHPNSGPSTKSFSEDAKKIILGLFSVNAWANTGHGKHLPDITHNTQSTKEAMWVKQNT
jgi:hypothetical protein